MGYTHYWTFKKPSLVKGNVDRVEATYKTAIAECAKIARVYNAECKTKGLDGERLSGFTAHTRANKYGGLEINGKADNAHEPFTMREHYRQNFWGLWHGFEFCKTAQKPYDVVVTACLAVLKHRLGDLIDVSSDGRATDWIDGVKLARRITGLKIKNPIDPKVDAIQTASKTKVKTVKALEIKTVTNPNNGRKYIDAKSLAKALKQAKGLGADLSFAIENIERIGRDA
jgi:hypothetical protein